MPHLARIKPLLALLLGAVSLRADIRIPAAAPPQAEAGSARVLRRAEVAIELRGHYGGAGAVMFGIVRPPRHGKLSRLQARSGNRATITYSHIATHPEKSDDLAYAIQAAGRLSSPAEVRIAVDEPPATLQTIAALDFGEIMAGESAVRELPITNGGGGILQGKMTASSPWRIALAEFRVAAGRTEAVRIAFQPNEAKNFAGQAALTDEAGNASIVSLSGIATPALRVAPDTLLFGAEPRRETVSLTNLAGSAVHLKFKASEHLQPIAEIDLPAGESTEIPVEVRLEVAGPIHETMIIAGPRFQVPLLLEIPALPPKIVAVSVPIATATATAIPVIPRLLTISATPLVTNPTPAPEAIPFVMVTGRRLGSSLWEIKWPATKARAASSYRIEERSLSLDAAGDLQTAWHPVKATIVSAGDSATAKISGLNDRHVHVLRVTDLDADGTALWQSPPVALEAVPAPAHVRGWWLAGLSLALAAFLFLRWRAL